MDKQEPEEQRLEEKPMEPAEDVDTSSDESVLSDIDASEPDEEPASTSQSVDDEEAGSAEDEAAADAPVEESVDADLSNAAEQDGELYGDDSIDDESAAEEAAIPVNEAIEADQVDIEQQDDEVKEGESETTSADDAIEPEPEPDDDPSDWFVVHCYSGYENKVRHNLEQRIETMGMKDMIFDVVVPTQEEIEVRDGKRRTVERHIFPGYVLVNMILTEESWYVVRNTPGVTGFVGMGNNPTPLRPEEVAQIVKRMEADAPTVKVTFKVGERVRIVDGPFNDFRGVVSEIDMERTKVRVMVSFFGRETPVELDFLQVEKA
jgi:transcriptional antiterminator NusG